MDTLFDELETTLPNGWRLIKINKLLKRSKISIDILDDVEYKRVTIKTKHQGVSLRDTELGKKIGTKSQFVLKKGQFVLSKIDARFGAFGIAPDEVDNAIITGNFWAFDVDFNLLDIEWFNQYTNSFAFYDLCAKASTGITQRKYLDEKTFLEHEILLPPIDIQKEIMLLVNNKNVSIANLTQQLEQQLQIIQQLRQAFLREAMQGKLVEQSATDEPATELLARIAAAKANSSTKRNAVSLFDAPPRTLVEDAPFDIPANWVWCRLGEICELIYGKGLTKNECVLNGKYPVFGSNGVIGYYNEYLTKRRAIIIGRKGSAGALNICNTPSWTSDVAYYVEEVEELNFYFQYYMLKFLKLENLGRGLKPGLSRAEAYELLIPLPPLAEQTRIVEKLDELMSVCDALQRNVENGLMQLRALQQVALSEALQMPSE